MKPKTKVMATGTMLGLTIILGALFFYIEEKKYEALYYQTELNKRQQQGGFSHLMQQIAEQGNNSAIKTLYTSPQIQALSAEQAQQLVTDINVGTPPDTDFTETVMAALKTLTGK
ncbi:MAG TPA: hypothetical protein ENJ65_07010 [Candidatus Tenderia electrophaga]|uniref:Uncharacterized protein n=1 Tax=Candidatus Tenderia electrophaga TaxID=1748243 RepID=A0A832N454_9GAMM|nr:hypothetical protein [Candidatus Tenderia electrophaga]